MQFWECQLQQSLAGQAPDPLCREPWQEDVVMPSAAAAANIVSAMGGTRCDKLAWCGGPPRGVPRGVVGPALLAGTARCSDVGSLLSAKQGTNQEQSFCFCDPPPPPTPAPTHTPSFHPHPPVQATGKLGSTIRFCLSSQNSTVLVVCVFWKECLTLIIIDAKVKQNMQVPLHSGQHRCKHSCSCDC